MKGKGEDRRGMERQEEEGRKRRKGERGREKERKWGETGGGKRTSILLAE